MGALSANAQKEPVRYNFQFLRRKLSDIGMLSDFDKLIRDEQIEYEQLVNELSSVHNFICSTTRESRTKNEGLFNTKNFQKKASLRRVTNDSLVRPSSMLNVQIGNFSPMRHWKKPKKCSIFFARSKSSGITGKEVWAGIREGEILEIEEEGISMESYRPPPKRSKNKRRAKNPAIKSVSPSRLVGKIRSSFIGKSEEEDNLITDVSKHPSPEVDTKIEDSEDVQSKDNSQVFLGTDLTPLGLIYVTSFRATGHNPSKSYIKFSV